MSKKPFHVVLTEDERERLDAHRAAMGLRSDADVIRAWIAMEPAAAAIHQQIDEIRASMRQGARRAPKGFKP